MISPCFRLRLRGNAARKRVTNPLRYVGRRPVFNAVRTLALGILLLAAPLAVLPAASAGPVRAEAPVRILAFGDSLTAGYGLATPDTFPVRLEAALRRRGISARIVNAGVSGDTSAGGRSRLDWAMAAAKPGFVIVELGANDGLRGLSPGETRANLAAILARLGKAGVGVLLAGMVAPPNLGREYGGEFNRVFPDLAREYGVALYPFFLDGVAARPALLQADGLHPNPAGVAEIVRRMMPAVESLISGH